jgi:hypothetical protein
MFNILGLNRGSCYRAEPSFPWVVSNRILDYFSNRLQYQMFVEDQVDDCRNPFEMATAGIAYGDKEFVKRIYAFSKKAEMHEYQPAIRSLQRSALEPNFETVLSAVEKAFPDASSCQKRRLLVWALHAYTWMKGSDIARSVRPKKSAVSKIIHGIQLDSMAVKEIESRSAAIAMQLGFPQKTIL